MYSYVLITPAKNEEANIGKVIKSVLEQTLLPKEWVIVSDGSSDKTDEIVLSYSNKHSFIKYKRNESSVRKDFSSKVNAFNIGYFSLECKEYEFIGNLDADVTFEPFYFEGIISQLNNNPKLGLAGGYVYELYNGKIRTIKKSFNSVSGAVQMFNRKCFEEIGGYLPIKIGGIDSAAEICARAKGWEVKTIKEYKIIHHGPILTGNKSKMKKMYHRGLNRYQLGYHPIFHLITCFGYILDSPFLFGAISFCIGYFVGFLKKLNKVLPDDVIEFLQNEQIKRISGIINLKRL